MANGKEVEVITEKGTPSEIIHFAIDKGADLDKLEKLLVIKREWDKDEARKAYHVAMASFKENPPMIEKDKTVSYKTERGTTTYNHATLANVTQKINAELSKYGLSASWRMTQNGAVTVTCRITHIKGHFEETSLSAPSDKSGSKNDIQAIGSTVTYLERYTLLALTGLATYDQDDDGRAAGPQVEYITDKEKGQLLDLMAQKSVDIKKFLLAFKIEELAQLPKARFSEACYAINVKKAKVTK